MLERLYTGTVLLKNNAHEMHKAKANLPLTQQNLQGQKHKSDGI